MRGSEVQGAQGSRFGGLGQSAKCEEQRLECIGQGGERRGLEAAKGLSFFRDYAREKWPLWGSKHAENLYRCQVSGVRKARRKILKPEH